MKQYGIRMIGKLIAFITSNISSIVYNSGYEGAIVHDSSTGVLYYGDSASGSFRSLIDIPRNSVFLFDADTAISGYSVLTNLDDKVVFITRGSSAGGEQGGSQKSGGTWSQPGHQHTLAGHTHTMNSHRHAISHTHSPTNNHQHMWHYSEGGISYSFASDGASVIPYTAYGTLSGGGLAVKEDGNQGYTHTRLFYTEGHTSGVDPWYAYSDYTAPGTTGASPDTTGGASYANTWRPKGRNTTRQQRL